MDAEVTQVLTEAEQQEYFDGWLHLASENEPGLFQCLQANCRGIGALPPDDSCLICPVCGDERCVTGNTRNWHAEVTCEQHRQRDRQNVLLPEQLRSMYNGKTVYQCGSCGFGPIEHCDCADLEAHHGQRVGNSGIQNSCPQWGWFAANIWVWPRWTG